ncbi:protein lethal(2)essential for life-like [Topomyia yanbarensis]|uniref:protein lethal(2)essential for life-like n=1 Tax=Topomyia yanbarensis TaxID=2498891 RepID=UPI00273BB6B3|nr:protein lethal(2)essential for life-like [Topomyia yanbarensis]
MSLVPILFHGLCDDSWDVPPRPSSILEKYFGEDFFPDELILEIDQIPNRRMVKRPQINTVDRQAQNNHAAVMRSKAGFQVSVDVQQFAPEEISVQMIDNFITVEGKHEEKQDEHGFVSRHFIRKYRLPEGHDADKVVSSLSSDGVLTIKAPKLALPESKTERRIPIEQTGKPIKKTEKK